MPVITFPFKEVLTGVRVRLPGLAGIWESVSTCSFDNSVKLIIIEDLHLDPGVSRRSVVITTSEMAELMNSTMLVSKPISGLPTSFVIFGHKSEVVPSLNEDELARMDSLGLTLLQNKTTNTSWFGKLIKTDPISTKDIAAARILLEKECNMVGMDLRLHDVDFLQDGD